MAFAYITEEGATIHKRGGRFVVSRNNEVMFELPIATLENVVVIDSVQISSQAITEFLDRGIHVTWLSDTGKFFGRLEATTNVDVKKHYMQMLLCENEEFYLNLARKVVIAKVDNQALLLKRYSRNCADATLVQDINNIYAIRKNLFRATGIEEIMGHEGYIARCYFNALGKVVKPDFRFTKRSKQPPRDAFNSMLSFGYTLLMYELYTAIIQQGLHPYFGFLHSLRSGHPALASDLIEEWRAVIVDAMVLSLIEHREIHLTDFRQEENGGVYLERAGRKKFLRAFERKMRSTNQYLGDKQSFRCGITQQVGDFSKAIMHKSADMYIPLKIR